jgi:hypothetical protein
LPSKIKKLPLWAQQRITPPETMELANLLIQRQITAASIIVA